MKLRLILFFLVIVCILESYILLDFQEVSYLENRTLRKEFEFENGWKSAVLDGDFQKQLEEILSDQIFLRSVQVKTHTGLSSLLGFHYRFSSDQYLYNNQIILALPSYTNSDYQREKYTTEFYKFIESITSEVEDEGADFSVYYANLEQYYCQITYSESCPELGTEKKNDNFYYANQILQNDEYAFIGGDHHLTTEAQYTMFQAIMQNWNMEQYIQPLSNYYDMNRVTEITGSRERLANYRFNVEGVEQAPKYSSQLVMYENGENYNISDLFEWNETGGAPLKNHLTPGYCGRKNVDDGRVETKTGLFYVENTDAPVDEKILVIGDSQICGLAPFLYDTFTETHTFDYRYQMIDVIDYVQVNDIDHVIYYGTDPFETLGVWFE